MKSVAILLALLPLVASAATMTVNTTADNTTAGDGLCTLREAIANLNAAAEHEQRGFRAKYGAGDTIQFSVAMPATIKLRPPGYGELAIARDLTIVGPGADLLAIDGRHRTRVFHITASSTSISGLTIQKGRSASRTYAMGGGVLVDSGATLDMTNCTLTGNNATCRGLSAEGAFAGGMHVWGTAALTNCTVRRNKARCGSKYSFSSGGGISVHGSGTLTLTNSTVSGNIATGRTAYGAGVSVPSGTGTVTNCTISGNKATGRDLGLGGGIVLGRNSRLTNCTVSGNEAVTRGHQDDGGGIYIQNSDGLPTLTNNVVASNGKVSNCVAVPFPPGGHNLSSDNTCSTIGGNDLLNTDPKLAPLANYGGPTETFALCTGSGVPHASCTAASPAIDVGDDSVTGPPDNLSTDQRGLPRLSGSHVDIGAYEVQ